MQVAYKLRDDVSPLANRFLSMDTDGRIPGAVRTIQQPAPIGIVRQQKLYRLAERGCKVRHRGVDTNDQVEGANDGGRVSKVAEEGREVGDRTRWKNRKVRSAGTDLKTEEMPIAAVRCRLVE